MHIKVDLLGALSTQPKEKILEFIKTRGQSLNCWMCSRSVCPSIIVRECLEYVSSQAIIIILQYITGNRHYPRRFAKERTLILMLLQ